MCWHSIFSLTKFSWGTYLIISQSTIRHSVLVACSFLLKILTKAFIAVQAPGWQASTDYKSDSLDFASRRPCQKKYWVSQANTRTKNGNRRYQFASVIQMMTRWYDKLIIMLLHLRVVFTKTHLTLHNGPSVWSSVHTMYTKTRYAIVHQLWVSGLINELNVKHVVHNMLLK